MGRPRRELPPELEEHLDVGRIVRVVVAAVVVLFVTLALWAFLPRSTALGGPLQDASLSGPMASGGRREAGGRASFGFVVPWNASEQEAVLDRLVPIAPTAGIEVIGAGVLGPEEDLVPFGAGYPPEGRLKPPPVRGYRIPPGSSALDSFQLVVGVRATGPGVHSIAGFVVEYSVGGTAYRAIVLQGVWICVSRDEEPGCPGKGDIVEQQEELRRTLLPYVDAPAR
jgi:hypothetical protein